MKEKSLYVAQGAIIATLYVVFTLIANALGLASGAIQIRFSEALTILPIFTSAAIPGLTIGCLISNLVTGCAIWDVVFGSVATMLGALGTRALRKNPILASFCPVISNILIVPWVLSLVYHAEGTIWYFALTVGIGEIISCVILGYLLRKSLEKNPSINWY